MMADVNEMFNETTKEESFFVPGKEKKKGLSQPIAKGEYFGHIIQCESNGRYQWKTIHWL